ncbi:hypothetical protein [Subtercola sp. RTI3]|uniref:hypothetical protein n=1 Tax=Subtercola sp. RTI3 TaxID=3048639 RepID=UPI002B23E608|nr:hypothetical protein [Subtercola sp. RTI3]MEA9986270.1 hypothetical protein [Subtercola sp. RTI3]
MTIVTVTVFAFLIGSVCGAAFWHVWLRKFLVQILEDDRQAKLDRLTKKTVKDRLIRDEVVDRIVSAELERRGIV